MKILSLSLDKSLLKSNSRASQRLARLSEVVEACDFIVPSEKKTVEVFNSQVRALGSGGQSKISKLFLIWRLARALIKGGRYDLITVQDTYLLAGLALFLAKANNLPLEVQVHGFEKESAWKRKVAKFILTRASGVRVVSERLKNDLVKNYGVSAERISIIPIFNKLSESAVVALKNNLVPEILAVGRLVPVKGFNYLIEAVSILAKKGLKFNLKIVGSGSEYYHLQKLIKRLALSDVVTLMEATTDIIPFYQAADLVVISSLKEGYSLVAVEAASFALPIVMTDVGLAGEILVEGESAKIVPAKDSKALAAAIEAVLSDKTLAETLGQKAKMAVSKLPNEVETLNLYKAAWAKLL